MDFKDLTGKILTHITVDDNKEKIYFTDSEGSMYLMYHSQDCCERVYVEDICGELDSLLNNPILLAEEICSTENPPDISIEYQDSFTWTFYKLSTIKGSVTIRWYGESNGYYSESVNFIDLEKEERW